MPCADCWDSEEDEFMVLFASEVIEWSSTESLSSSLSSTIFDASCCEVSFESGSSSIKSRWKC